MAKGRGTGSMNFPIGKPAGLSIQQVMPQFQQQAQLQGTQARQQMAAQSPSVQNPLQAAGIMPSQQGNFKQVPKTVEVGGVPQTIPEVQEKKDIPYSTLTDITGTRTTAKLLAQNVDQIINDPVLRSQIGPIHASTHGGLVGALGTFARHLMDDPTLGAFAEFKSHTQDVFQNYRKLLEGVRGAVGGSALISPVLPEMTDTDEVYVGKAIGALGKMKMNDQIMEDALKGQNYKTAGIEGKYPVRDVEAIRNSAVQQGINVGKPPVPGMPSSPAQDSTGGDSDMVSVTNGSKTFSIPKKNLATAQSRGFNVQS